MHLPHSGCFMSVLGGLFQRCRYLIPGRGLQNVDTGPSPALQKGFQKWLKAQMKPELNLAAAP